VNLFVPDIAGVVTPGVGTPGVVTPGVVTPAVAKTRDTR